MAPVKTVSFVAGAPSAHLIPPPVQPEVAIAGRSNVGKSSLLNRLVGRQSLARVSKTPGRTQQINFFLVNDEWYLVDLPGYGFARVPLAVKAQWQGLVESYLSARRTLCGVAVLVDIRRGVEADDALLLDFLAAHAIPTLLVATKIDKLPFGQRQRQLAALRAQQRGPLLGCSAASGEGIEALRAAIHAWLPT